MSYCSGSWRILLGSDDNGRQGSLPLVSDLGVPLTGAEVVVCLLELNTCTLKMSERASIQHLHGHTHKCTYERYIQSASTRSQRNVMTGAEHELRPGSHLPPPVGGGRQPCSGLLVIRTWRSCCIIICAVTMLFAHIAHCRGDGGQGGRAMGKAVHVPVQQWY